MRQLLSRIRRRHLVVTAVLAVALAGWWAVRTPSPVGYFTSAAAQDRFLRAYDRAMEDLPEPDRTLDVRTGYGVVRLYHFAGARPDAAPLLLLPGTRSASPVWADNLPSLLRLRGVYVVDLLGEPGMSVQQRPISSPRDHARWLHELLLSLPEPQVHLVGLSIGGWTAMNLAVHRPEKLASVTLIEPVRVYAELSIGAIARSVGASVRWLPRSFRDDFASWTANDAPVEDVPVARMIEAGMQTYVVKKSGPTKLTDKQLAGVRMPTLAILAGASRMHDADEAASVARRVPAGATVHVYPDASHAINGEYPDRIASDLGAFLAGRP
ncbi:alpha/beta fold hydrolase [Virgisporangium ochraceum]|uniref:Alpha/beta hydrolase n=1 Tax=Virgisporangium ochraceum TaxID=65505 RepID=A0A8J4EGH6_9ACTN|nr:alpha/beta hydrolase [Virgisporangium ochraceum]GIJ73899.1 alpha/beta hydrolase [Virgisporangium ochraceum]